MNKKSFVSGCFDLLHSGHVAFFQEAATYGDLYVAIGSDRNILELKQRPTINSEAERLYMIQSLACVKQAFVAKGSGILDFVEELKQIRPDRFVVNEDGSTPEKKKLCEELGIEYVILKREPHSGLTARSTTALRSESRLPEALELAGVGLDQPAVSKLAPGPVLSISIHPAFEGSSKTRKAAVELWGARLPADQPEKLAKTLFGYSNLPGSWEFSGSASAIGIAYPGISRAEYAGEYWPRQINNERNEQVLQFIEDSLYLLPLEARVTAGRQLDPSVSRAVSRAAEACWQAVLSQDRIRFGESLRQSFEAQVALFPELLSREAQELIDATREQALGWSIWNCAGGANLLVVADRPVEGARRINIRRGND
jgi:cytidyltransferase-like protein